MKNNVHPAINNRGLTLLEIVITLTVAAILGTIVFMFMSASLTHSTEPITLIQKAYSLDQIVEQITADYKTLLETDGDPLGTLDGRIAGNNYGQYSSSTGFIAFDGNNNEVSPDPSGENRILKVGITANNQTITVLFTK